MCSHLSDNSLYAWGNNGRSLEARRGENSLFGSFWDWFHPTFLFIFVWASTWCISKLQASKIRSFLRYAILLRLLRFNQAKNRVATQGTMQNMVMSLKMLSYFMEQLHKIERPCDIPDMGAIADLTWSDPDPNTLTYTDSPRGAAHLFGPQVLEVP